MIPSPDFRFDISITIAEEVLRMGFATIGFAIAVWGIVKIVGLLVKNAEDRKGKEDGCS